jgi:protein ImuB
LPAAPETLAILRRWGISTLGQLAGLPELGLTERLGQSGSHLRRLALGRAVRILDPDSSVMEYAARQALDHPVELLEPLLFVVSAQLHDLAKRLDRDGRAAARIVVILELEEHGEYHRSIDLPYPMRDAKALLKQVQLALEAHPPKAATVAVCVALEPADPRIHQSGMFLSAAPEPEKLETLIARLQALVGPERVGSPEILETHRPDAYRLRPCAFRPAASAPALPNDRSMRLAFRYFRPPIAARVAVDAGQPKRIASSHASGAIIEAAGPWRSSGEWWDATQWDRDEWDVVLEDRGAYRLYVASQRWFLDGSYD